MVERSSGGRQIACGLKSLAATGIAAASPLLVSIVTGLLNRSRAAIGIALVGSFGLLGGAVGPPLSERMLRWGGSAGTW